jgi:hypothetical protein
MRRRNGNPVLLLLGLSVVGFVGLMFYVKWSSAQPFRQGRGVWEYKALPDVPLRLFGPPIPTRKLNNGY